MNDNNKKHIVVVGGGPGGLSAAMLLAHRGFQVTVLEKESTVGGRTAELKLGDYQFDLGPTFLMMKFILDGLFDETGRKIEDYLDCRRLDTMYKLEFADKSLHVTGDREKMRQRIEAVFPGEGQALDRFYERESARFKKLYPCLQKDYGNFSSFLSSTLLSAFPHVAAGRSLYGVLSDYFESEELRLAFTFQSKYLGMSPWECPGLFAMIPFVEHAYGVYHVMGGLSQIPKAFAKVALEEGAVIRTSAPVRRVLIEGRKACGVELESGEILRADDVVLNADFGHAMSTLFPSESLRKYKPEQLRKRRYSCSTFMMYLGLDKLFDAEHHTIFFAENYRKNLEAIAQNSNVMSDDVSVYVRNASIMDPNLAPAGHSALYVLSPVANNLSGIDWDKEKAAFRENILRILERRGGFEGIRSHIREEVVITPADWERQHSIFLGATFNMGHDLSQMLYLRPHNEFEEFSNCYLVGGGTHPGSGLPTIFESARISTNLLCKKYGLAPLKPRPFIEGVSA